jgi:hypothetical protein
MALSSCPCAAAFPLAVAAPRVLGRPGIVGPVEHDPTAAAGAVFYALGFGRAVKDQGVL